MLRVRMFIMQRITKFTDAPYKVGTYAHHTKNFQSSLAVCLYVNINQPYSYKQIPPIIINDQITENLEYLCNA